MSCLFRFVGPWCVLARSRSDADVKVYVRMESEIVPSIRSVTVLPCPPAELFAKLVESRNRVAWDVMATEVCLTIQRVTAGPSPSGAGES
jgi:hypothetical protein